MKLVIDIGGTSVKVGKWENTQLEVITTFGSPKTWIELKGKLQKILDYDIKGITSVNFSVPGVPNHQNGCIDGASSLAYLHEVNFIEEMRKIFAVPVYFENDATCASLAEIHLGAGKKYNDMLFVVIGTGIGGSVVYDRKIINGKHGYAGEFGMMLVDGVQEWAVLGSAVHMAKKVSEIKQEELTGEEVFKLSEQGDVIAVKATEELYHYLALGIYNLQYMFDPEVIILGGGISRKPQIIDDINRHLKKIMEYGQRSPLFPKLTTCKFGNDANLIGAAMLN